MKQIRLKDAFPPMDEGFERAVNRAFGQIREEKQMKYTRKFSLALVMLLMIALAGTALAAGYISSLRQELEGINATGAMDAVQKPGQSVEANGCTVTVKETLVEGSAAWVTLEVMTPEDKPMMMAYWENDDRVVFSDGLLEAGMKMIGGEYGHEVVVKNGDWAGERIDDMVVDLEMVFVEPAAELIVDEKTSVWEFFEEKKEAPDQLTLYPVSGNVVYINHWDAGYQGTDAPNGARYEKTIANMEDAGVVKNVCRVTVPIELKAEEEGAYMRHNVKQSEFQFDGYKVIVDEVSIGEMDGTLHLCVIPERDMEIMTMDNDDPLWRHYVLIDAETGEQFMTSSGGGTVEDENGKVYYEQSLHVRNMGTHSDTIRVVPEKKGTFELDDEGEFVIELLP